MSPTITNGWRIRLNRTEETRLQDEVTNFPRLMVQNWLLVTIFKRMAVISGHVFALNEWGKQGSCKKVIS